MQRRNRLGIVLAAFAISPGAVLAQPDAMAVATAAAEPIEVMDMLRLTGTMTAARHAELSPRVDGLVSTLHVDAGDRVAAGDVLLELDAELARHAQRRAEAAVTEARAALVEAERLIEEARPLIAERHLPETELARREADAELARARLAASEAAAAEQAELVRRHSLPAPFDGVIAARLTDVGEWVVRGTPVLELVSTEAVRLDVRAPQESFTRIGSDARVEVYPDALPGRSFPARLAARVPVGDSAARSFLVRIVIEAPGVELPPGTSATAVIALHGASRALAVPSAAVRRYPDGSHSVFVVAGDENATVRERRVAIGNRDGDRVEVLRGLERGERVVVSGWDALRDGQRVRVQDDS